MPLLPNSKIHNRKILPSICNTTANSQFRSLTSIFRLPHSDFPILDDSFLLKPGKFFISIPEPFAVDLPFVFSKTGWK